MNELLKAIYDCLYTRKDTTDAVAEIEDCHRQLIERLDKPERTHPICGTPLKRYRE